MRKLKQTKHSRAKVAEKNAEAAEAYTKTTGSVIAVIFQYGHYHLVSPNQLDSYLAPGRYVYLSGQEREDAITIVPIWSNGQLLRSQGLLFYFAIETKQTAFLSTFLRQGPVKLDTTRRLNARTLTVERIPKIPSEET